MHIRDINATILHQLGLDHERLSIKFQGLDLRLTGVEEAGPIREILGLNQSPNYGTQLVQATNWCS